MFSQGRARKLNSHPRDTILYESSADCGSQTNWDILHTENAFLHEHSLYDSVTVLHLNEFYILSSNFEFSIKLDIFETKNKFDHLLSIFIVYLL